MQGLTVNSLIIIRIFERKQFVKYIKSSFDITHNPGSATVSNTSILVVTLTLRTGETMAIESHEPRDHYR